MSCNLIYMQYYLLLKQATSVIFTNQSDNDYTYSYSSPYNTEDKDK